MKTKNIKVTEKLNNAIETAKSSVKKANDYALNTTEEVVLETITIAEKWQKVTDKALKGGVKLMENQQNLDEEKKKWEIKKLIKENRALTLTILISIISIFDSCNIRKITIPDLSMLRIMKVQPPV